MANKKQRVKNRMTNQILNLKTAKPFICKRCNQSGSHYVPASLGDAAFYTCTPPTGAGEL